MGLEDIVDKAKNLVTGHKDQAEQGIDKAADLAKDKVGHDEQVDAAAQKAKDVLGEQS
jgi:hypothetical protein